MGAKDWLSAKLNQGSEGDRADYESGAGADDITKADKKTRQVMGLLGAQRGANRTFGRPDPTDEEHQNRY